ncbi:hypothetical protein LCGC14_1798910 [marine sediment metagenome]|uniref:Nucleotidyl transferase domain-containing protein n=1 Tax=marine sediment metagenome TaxID=412755 RepID=A0A0F9JPU3_9ZZZZ
MKGLILSGGKGTRLRPLTFTRAKQLIPIANKPNLFYVVEDLVAAGITDIGVVISPETGDEIRSSLTDANTWGATFTFIEQAAPNGLAHAVKTALPYLGDDPFVMYLGDNLLNGGIGHIVDEFTDTAPDSIVLLTPVKNPSQFGVAELDDEGRVVRLVEKPAEPRSNLALVGVYVFNAKIHGIIEKLRPSGRGEYEITDAIQGLIDAGQRVVAHKVRGWWKDTGRPEDLLEANRLVLGNAVRTVAGEIDDSRIDGAVVVEKGAKISHSTIRGPAHIAAGAVIESSYIGPYTAIGPGAKVIHSEVEYSILLHEAEVRHLGQRMDASVIGQGVVVDGSSSTTRKNAIQLVLGDYSQVNL